ncbi:MAG TPA: class II aldolase/adducin family protein [Planctomycetota bacterium]
MRSRWEDAEARAFVDRYGEEHGATLAHRVYSSRLLGSDPGLVLHGGGNTSAKDARADLFGEVRQVLFVKGSGWDLASIEPAGLPALDLEGLRRLQALDELDDQQMVNQLRRHLHDANAPNPSVETLLHAFLPHRFVDHSHADAVLACSNLPDGPERCLQIFGARVAALPFVMPGFPLAKAVAAACAEQPGVEGVLLHQHGLFTFGADARESYERHVALVDLAERALTAGARPKVRMPVELDAARARASALAPLLRGALARSAGEAAPAAQAGGDAPTQRLLLEWREDAGLLPLLDDAELAPSLLGPPPTPDHAIRTKPWPCWIDVDWRADAAKQRAQVEAALAGYVDAYRAYFARGVAARGPRQALDPAPRVLLVPGCGLFAAGESVAACGVAADLAQRTLQAKAAGRSLGPFAGLGELDNARVGAWVLDPAVRAAFHLVSSAGEALQRSAFLAWLRERAKSDEKQGHQFAKLYLEHSKALVVEAVPFAPKECSVENELPEPEEADLEDLL